MLQRLFFLLITLMVPSWGDPLIHSPRVRSAFDHHRLTIAQRLRTHALPLKGNHLLLVGYKREQRLEAWVRPHTRLEYVKVWEAPFCTSSGDLGPKRREGDRQIPEGVYTITHFNPLSAFHLSMQVSYPNASDRRRGDPSALGGEIFIHGACVSVGCIALSDPIIEELFVLALSSRRPIHVLLFPTALSDKTLHELQTQHYGSDALRLWHELHPIYDYWDRTHRLPPVFIDQDGTYHLRSQSSLNNAVL